MSDQESNPLLDALDSAADKVFPETVEAEAPEIEESVAKTDTSAGQGAPEDLQGGVEDNPEPPSAADLAKAWQEIGRAKGKYGTEPAGIAGKSDAELVAFATELETLRRQESREHFEQAQGESTPTTGDEDPGSAGPVGTETPAKLEALLTSLKEEGLDEAAAQLEGLIGGQQSQIDALVARLDGEAQARQLEPIQKAADDTFAGFGDTLPDLSKSQREDLMEAAAVIGKLNPAKYEKMSPAERVQSTLSQAIEVGFGVKAAKPKAKARPVQRRQAEGISSGNTASSEADTPTGMAGCLDRAADRAFDGWPG